MNHLELISMNQLEARLSLTKSPLYEMLNTGLLPRPIAISTRRKAWLAHEIDGWVALRARGAGDAEIIEYCAQVEAERLHLFDLIKKPA